MYQNWRMNVCIMLQIHCLLLYWLRCRRHFVVPLPQPKTTCLEFGLLESTRTHGSRALPDFVFVQYFMLEWMTLDRSRANSSLEAQFLCFGLGHDLSKEVSSMAAGNLPNDASMCFAMAGCRVDRLHFAVSVQAFRKGGPVLFFHSWLVSPHRTTSSALQSKV